MIVLDTLMNQQDRFGNIHYLETFYYRNTSDLNSDGTPRRGAERSHLSSDSVQQTRDRGVRCPVAQLQIFKFIFRDRVAQPFDLKQRRRQLREVGRGRSQ